MTDTRRGGLLRLPMASRGIDSARIVTPVNVVVSKVGTVVLIVEVITFRNNFPR